MLKRKGIFEVNAVKLHPHWLIPICFGLPGALLLMLYPRLLDSFMQTMVSLSPILIATGVSYWRWRRVR